MKHIYFFLNRRKNTQKGGGVFQANGNPTGRSGKYDWFPVTGTTQLAVHPQDLKRFLAIL
jgi:hypothetical protein